MRQTQDTLVKKKITYLFLILVIKYVAQLLGVDEGTLQEKLVR